MTRDEAMQRIETQFAHVWMVRTFLKHSDEAEDEDIADVYRTLYDCQRAVGNALEAGDAAEYVKQTKKKYRKLREAMELYCDVQPEVSTHTNFQMAATSLRAAVEQIGSVLESVE